MSTDAPMYEGSCLCGQIKIQVVGPPTSAGYCHCKRCQTWHAAPVNAYCTYPHDAVHVVQGEGLIKNYKDESGRTNRQWCGNCGAGLMNRLRDVKLGTVVYAMILAESGYVHKASHHINCDEAVLDLHDGILKYMGWPDSETMGEPSQTRMRPSAT